MSDEMHFEPVPGVAFLCSDMPTAIVDVIVRHCPPGTPAPPRPDRPHLPNKRSPSDGEPDSPASAGGD
ncbi:MAG: hypothetical protein HYS12_07305 [Planctomycetes bacterium]|nr:hypothetical protein [Planctomycetota bacterium]